MCHSWAFCICQTFFKDLTNKSNGKFDKTNFEVILSCNGSVLQ